jgi:hypothetical protein
LAANSTGGAGGAASAGNGGNGATANSSAKATGGAVSVTAMATGGAGGNATGAGKLGGKGAGSILSVDAVGQQSATASAYGYGGAGGLGLSGAGGGAGGIVNLNDAVAGTTVKGMLTLQQDSQGGVGGNADTGTAGMGGNASSVLNLNDTTSNQVTVNLSARGGTGGNASGIGGVNGIGGNGTASDQLEGIGSVNSTVGAAGGASDLTGGNATATSNVTAATISSVATATAGGGAGTGGQATATAIGDGTGTVQATASTAPSTQASLVTGISATSRGMVTSDSGTTLAETLYGGNTPAFNSTDLAVADGVAAPTSTQTNAVFSAQPNIKTAFGTSPSFFSLGEVGGGHSSAGTASETTTSTVTTNVNLSDLSPTGDLALGLYDGKLVGTGVTSVSLTVSANNVTLVNDQNMSAATALSTFTDDGLSDLEALATSGPLALTITLTVVTDKTASGFYGDFILGDPVPEKPAAAPAVATETPAQAAQLANFVSAMAGFGGKDRAGPIFATVHQPESMASHLAVARL